MGLRQLYFLIGDLLKRLVYLSLGLAFILAFIGVKLILHALHENELPFINGGEHVCVPEIPSLLSLGVIVGHPGGHRRGQPAGRAAHVRGADRRAHQLAEGAGRRQSVGIAAAAGRLHQSE